MSNRDPLEIKFQIRSRDTVGALLQGLQVTLARIDEEHQGVPPMTSPSWDNEEDGSRVTDKEAIAYRTKGAREATKEDILDLEAVKEKLRRALTEERWLGR